MDSIRILYSRTRPARMCAMCVRMQFITRTQITHTCDRVYNRINGISYICMLQPPLVEHPPESHWICSNNTKAHTSCRYVHFIHSIHIHIITETWPTNDVGSCVCWHNHNIPITHTYTQTQAQRANNIMSCSIVRTLPNCCCYSGCRLHRMFG